MKDYCISSSTILSDFLSPIFHILSSPYVLGFAYPLRTMLAVYTHFFRQDPRRKKNKQTNKNTQRRKQTKNTLIFLSLQVKMNLQFTYWFSFNSYIIEVLCEEAITFLIMERESCEYNLTAMARALGMDKPLTTIYFEKWYDILPKIKMPSVTDKEARHTYEEKMRSFVETTPNTIRYNDIPWPCDGTPEDIVAVMLSGEQKDTMKKRIKELALFWHPDK